MVRSAYEVCVYVCTVQCIFVLQSGILLNSIPVEAKTRSTVVYTAETEPGLGCWATKNLQCGMFSCIGLKRVPQRCPAPSDRCIYSAPSVLLLLITAYAAWCLGLENERVPLASYHSLFWVPVMSLSTQTIVYLDLPQSAPVDGGQSPALHCFG